MAQGSWVQDKTKSAGFPAHIVAPWALRIRWCSRLAFQTSKGWVRWTFRAGEAALIRRCGPLQRGVVQVSDPLAIADIFEDLHRSAQTGSLQSTEICLLLLQGLVLRIAELGTDRLNTNERALQSYRRCRACIETEARTLKTLTDIARKSHLNPAYLCRIFRRFAGTTPYKHLMRQKMNQAADRLQHSDMLVKEVANELGFSDPFHFSRGFKAVHGISPQRFIEVSRRQ